MTDPDDKNLSYILITIDARGPVGSGKSRAILKMIAALRDSAEFEIVKEGEHEGIRNGQIVTLKVRLRQ